MLMIIHSSMNVAVLGQGGRAVQPVLPLALHVLPSLLLQGITAAQWNLGFQTLTFAHCGCNASVGMKQQLTTFQ